MMWPSTGRRWPPPSSPALGWSEREDHLRFLSRSVVHSSSPVEVYAAKSERRNHLDCRLAHARIEKGTSERRFDGRPRMDSNQRPSDLKFSQKASRETNPAGGALFCPRSSAEFSGV